MLSELTTQTLTSNEIHVVQKQVYKVIFQRGKYIFVPLLGKIRFPSFCKEGPFLINFVIIIATTVAVPF